MNNIENKRETILQAHIDQLKQQLEEQKKSRYITCLSCRKKTLLSKAVMISEFYYVKPYGCTGGDYHDLNQYLHYCDKCNSFNRAYVGSWDKIDKTGRIKPESLKNPNVQLYLFIKKHKHYFGEQLSLYGNLGQRGINEIREENKKDKSYL